MNHFFEEQYKNTANRTRINYGLSLASFLGSWSFAYSMKFKRSSFISLTLLTAFATFKGLEYTGTKSLQRKLNSKACDIAKNYPEIKFSNVVYTDSSEVSKRNLPLYWLVIRPENSKYYHDYIYLFGVYSLVFKLQ